MGLLRVVRCWPLLALFTLAGPVPSAIAEDAKFKSPRSECKFLGAIQVTLEISTAEEDPKMSKLTFDQNTITHNPFGDPMVTEKQFQPFTVNLTRLKSQDPAGLGRKLYSVRFPDGQVGVLGKNALQLVWPLRPGEREG